ncbi:hypothetical protein CI102_10112 [Trichoderma harzianum]|nr:hypothetical protein CI102_10112 [Trichoderma harzianum]
MSKTGWRWARSVAFILPAQIVMPVRTLNNDGICLGRLAHVWVEPGKRIGEYSFSAVVLDSGYLRCVYWSYWNGDCYLCKGGSKWQGRLEQFLYVCVFGSLE